MTYVLALARRSKPDRFVFLYDNANEQTMDKLLRQFAKFAVDPELDFTWGDACCLAQRLRENHPQGA